jgi:hypothetical protein
MCFIFLRTYFFIIFYFYQSVVFRKELCDLFEKCVSDRSGIKNRLINLKRVCFFFFLAGDLRME